MWFLVFSFPAPEPLCFSKMKYFLISSENQYLSFCPLLDSHKSVDNMFRVYEYGQKKNNPDKKLHSTLFFVFHCLLGSFNGLCLVTLFHCMCLVTQRCLEHSKAHSKNSPYI